MSKTRLAKYKVQLVKEKSALYDISKNISGPQDAHDAIVKVTEIDLEAQEVFGIIALDTKNKIMAIHEVFRGSLNECMVHSREIFKTALLHNAAHIILFHNHPSGDPMASQNDIEVTKKMIECGKLLGIQVLDHIIVGEYGKYVSLKESNLI